VRVSRGPMELSAARGHESGRALEQAVELETSGKPLNPTHRPPLFKIPDGILIHTPKMINWMTVSSWYYRSWESVYFDFLYYSDSSPSEPWPNSPEFLDFFYNGSKLQRFKIIVKPDLSDVSLKVINIPEVVSVGFMKSLASNRVCEGYRICEGAFVCFWKDRTTWGAYTGLTSAPFTNVVTRWNGSTDSLCPASGRFVYCTDNGDESFITTRLVVVDLF
jgi:hypothetical protein